LQPARQRRSGGNEQNRHGNLAPAAALVSNRHGKCRVDLIETDQLLRRAERGDFAAQFRASTKVHGTVHAGIRSEVPTQPNYTKVSYKSIGPAWQAVSAPSVSPEDAAEGVVPSNSTIAVVDDDTSVREALKGLLKSAGFHAEAFASAEEFLDSGQLEKTSCLILDVRMPGMGGLELQRRVVAGGYPVPVIFITAHGDEELRARALEAGAADYLYKPFGEQTLLDAIARCLGSSPSGK
jgi:CheY-like chemotaxis protein